MTDKHLGVARLALQLVGKDLSKIDIVAAPVICKDSEGHFHRSDNAIQWFEHKDGVSINHGFITKMGRVTQFSHDKNFTGQKVLPFGGSWESEAETQYQNFRWLSWSPAG